MPHSHAKIIQFLQRSDTVEVLKVRSKHLLSAYCVVNDAYTWEKL